MQLRQNSVRYIFFYDLTKTAVLNTDKTKRKKCTIELHSILNAVARVYTSFFPEAPDILCI
jgi:hypothetical protein